MNAEMSLSLVVKAGSIARHVEEALSDDAHHFDIIALRSLLEDPEVKAWLTSLDAKALLPVKRGS